MVQQTWRSCSVFSAGTEFPGALAMTGTAVWGSALGDVQARLIGVPVAFGVGLAVALAVQRKRGLGMALVGTGVPAVNHVGVFIIPGLLPFQESLPGFAEMALTALVLAMFIGIIALRIRDENQALEILPESFARIHRTYVVNLDQVESYRHLGGSRYAIRLKNGDILPMSRHRLRELERVFGKDCPGRI
ncbi:MAG: LytTR family DNA-binding domain-containing protein [Acidobacteriota bacterium]